MRIYQFFTILLIAFTVKPVFARALTSSSTTSYQGELTSHLDASNYTKTSVSASFNINTLLNQKAKSPMVLNVKDTQGQVQLTLTLNRSNSKTWLLKSSLGLAQAVTLHMDADFCYSSSDAKVHFCADSSRVNFEIQSPNTSSDLLLLSLHHGDQGAALANEEPPQPFTLSKAIETARVKSFASRIEFEHLVQAKAHSRAAYLHLLPQITLGTFVNNLTPSFSTILSAIGDLAPFLLPGRWLQADQAKLLSKAEQEASILMRLDMGVQIEGLFYTYDRDRKTRDFTQDILTRATSIRDEVKVREDLGQLPDGSTQNLNSIINQIQQNLSVLNQVNVEDLVSISQSLGFYNPEAVSAANIDVELVPIENAQTIDYETVRTAALTQSYELRQMDDLIAAAKDTKSAAYYSWLDPYGDPNLGLGAALPAQVTVLNSQINELKVDREQLQSILSQKVFDTITNYKQALESYKLAVDGMIVQQSRLDSMLINLSAGVNVDFFGLIGVLQDYMSGEIAIESARANYRVARAQIDRFLLRGFYDKF